MTSPRRSNLRRGNAAHSGRIELDEIDLTLIVFAVRFQDNRILGLSLMPAIPLTLLVGRKVSVRQTFQLPTTL
jgi:hypothetical protein